MSVDSSPPPTDSVEPTPEPIRTGFDRWATPPSTEVVETVSVAGNAAPADLPPPVSAVDPDALDPLFGHGIGSRCRRNDRITFASANHRVTEDGRGEAVVPVLCRPE